MKKQIKKGDVTFTLSVEPEYTPIKGNAIASGDSAFDANVEKELQEKVNRGDVWAWCTVSVTGTYKGITATEYLGCCSYENEAEFKKDAYYSDMCSQVVELINERLADIFSENGYIDHP